MKRLLLSAAVLLAGCTTNPALHGAASTSTSQTPIASHSTTPSSSPSASSAPSTAQSYGVFIDGTLSTYTLLMIQADGKTVAQVKATMPPVYRYTHLPPAPPVVSLSSSRAYYADGSSIKYLMPDGSTAIVMPYPGAGQSVAGFAVSPDDKRIAVGLMRFSNPDTYQDLDLFVEDVGGGNRVELFTSNTVAEWPVAWANGRLVIAVGPAFAGNASTNPYNGFLGYHIADAATGRRVVTMSNECLFGPLEAAGSACKSGDLVAAQSFDGSNRVFRASAGAGPNLALSPDGSQIAGALGQSIVAFGYFTGEARPLNAAGFPMGWIDNNHLVFYRPNSVDRGILDLGAGSVPRAIPIAACSCGNPGVFFGALPPIT